MSTPNEVESRLTEARQAYEATQHILDGMKDGERVQIKDLAKDVGLALACDPKDVLGFVHHFVHKTTIAYITRGKNGGVIKGPKPAKVVKAPKKVASISTVDSTTDAA